MGVMNLTPDSFSDGGALASIADACRTAGRQLQQGAAVLDLGGQSTRPGAVEVTAAEEATRLLPALRAVRTRFPEAILSVDTFHAAVAEAALDVGADWINDVTGGKRDPAILDCVRTNGCPYVLMHHRAPSSVMNQHAHYTDVVREVHEELLFATERVIKAGVKQNQIIWDPGIGFAKTTDQSLALMRHLSTLKREGFPLLVGPSRKRFIGDVLNQPRPKARIWGTAAAVCLAVAEGADIVRVHDVGAMVATVKMAEALWPRAPQTAA
ncbi:dihydropteroate synthase [Synechococcus sp. RSCCF101]|nr:dihydropteroate synthase [Synechococcus sp. RSCCF101]